MFGLFKLGDNVEEEQFTLETSPEAMLALGSTVQVYRGWISVELYSNVIGLGNVPQVMQSILYFM